MSLLNAIRKLYGETVSQVDNSSKALEFLTSGTNEEAFSTSITDPLNNVVIDLQWDPQNMEVTQSFAHGDQIIVDQRVSTVTSVELIPDVINKLIYDGGYSETLSLDKLTSNVAETGDVYQLLAEVTSGYTVGVKQDSATLCSLINSKVNLSATDKEKLISGVQNLQIDGQLSQYGWLSLVNAIFNAIDKHTVDDSTLEIVSGSPFTLQSIANIVTEVIKTVVSGILSALQVICRGIIAVIATVLQLIMQSINLIAPTDIIINQEDSTDYIEGSNIVLNINDSHDIIFGYGRVAHPYPDAKYFDSSHNGVLTMSPGVDMYMWKQDAKNFIVNGRLAVNIDPTRLHTYINNRVTYTWVSAETQIVMQINTPLWPVTFNSDSENFFMTDEESMQARYDADYADKAILASLLALGLPFYQNTGKVQIAAPFQVSLNENNITIFDLMPCLGSWAFSSTPTWTAKKQTTYTKLYKALWNSVVTKLDGYTLTDLNREDTWTITTSISLANYLSTLHQWDYVIPRDIITFLGNFDVDYISQSQQYVVSIEQYDETSPITSMVIDSVPPTWTYRPASFSVGQVVLAVTTIAILATAIFVTGKLVKKAIANRSRIKQLDRVDKLNQARANYLANPTKANAAALNKQVNSYNRLGKLLGWDSYDLTNNWYTARGSQAVNTGSSLIKGMLENETPTDYIARLITG